MAEVIAKQLKHLRCKTTGYDLDARQKIDLVTHDNKSVSCRFRRNKYYRYFKDITFTHNKKHTDYLTEYEVFLINPPDLFFYAFTDITDSKIIAWRLFNLKTVVIAINRNFIKLPNGLPHNEKGYDYKILTSDNLYKVHQKRPCIHAWIDAN